ncbi:SidA/IucD/PvdA family monooxygenase [Paraburkholderia silviterrae]|uniref:Hydroxylase n=1 Tax=Paraburkholderia silviterrae TaxID=2528715 RepID=A0A4R5MBJ5_9BURK|nr:SidA/IucD/PvdA family monooxygenase [Paraburkholderia silviterrae]TDG24171.1 hydroxylase [Paraburkholderia silviterrae]
MSTPTARKTTKSRRVQIAVIGGGPKAAAIAAKAKVLRDLGIANVRVTIFEAEHIGAYWSGRDTGYTDGEQRLCTIAERDVGYPYKSMFGSEVDVAMASNFSWGTFLHGRTPGYEHGYSTWVDAGRKPPRHKHFADYLQWVIVESEATVVNKRVTALDKDTDDKRWRIDSQRKSGSASTHRTRFNAVVVTGPGPANRLPVKPARSATVPRDRIFDGSNFWSRRDEVLKGLEFAKEVRKYSDNPIVIVGAGGTAAAILSWLVANGARDLPIQLVAGQPTLYTRVDSVFENRLFTDEEQWLTLSSELRKAFFDRLNRGVVWATVMDHVSSATNFTMVVGRAQTISVPTSGDIELSVRRDDGVTVQLRPSLLIDASGFDAWWFLSLVRGLPAPLRTKRQRAKQRDQWQISMANGLQLTGQPWDAYPALHAPMLSSNVGPGFGSLMVLGAMADRVIKAHI